MRWAWVTSFRNQRGKSASVSLQRFALDRSVMAPGTKTPREKFRAAFLPHTTNELAGGAQVHLALCDRRQLLVGGLFFIEGLLQHAGAIVAAELLGPGDQTAVA